MSDEYTMIRGVQYPMLANISPEDMIEAYKMGEKKWRYLFVITRLCELEK